ncbi:MAG: DUF805 domain-containing protein [Hyphomicrobiaceae bacterium]|nr:DUF805 domain-containing protein [Hyphomicrobiaceae bacterium]
MGLWHMLFGFSGRINRFQFWMGHNALVGIIVAAALILYSQAGAFTSGSGNAIIGALGMGLVVVAFAVLLLVWCSSALLIKRMHDRNKGWVWMLAFAVPGLLSLPAGLALGGNPAAMPDFSILESALNIALLGWYVVEFGGMPGTPGGNAYGPPPDGGMANAQPSEARADVGSGSGRAIACDADTLVAEAATAPMSSAGSGATSGEAPADWAIRAVAAIAARTAGEGPRATSIAAAAPGAARDRQRAGRTPGFGRRGQA